MILSLIRQSTTGHYRVTGSLGEGGMGVVYRATDTKLNRDIAINVLPETFAADTERLSRFTCAFLPDRNPTAGTRKWIASEPPR